MGNTQNRALGVFPAGISNGEYGLPEERIVVIEKGVGCRLWDTRGREFLDFSMAWGACLVGHAHPEIVEAISAQAPNGSNFAYLNSHVLALAEEIQRISPAAERLRFCASGTEATMYCQRLARATTSRGIPAGEHGDVRSARYNIGRRISSFFALSPPLACPALACTSAPSAKRRNLIRRWQGKENSFHKVTRSVH